jgi:hypothetical protein
MNGKPTLCNTSFQTGFVFHGTATALRERRVDQLNRDTAILHGLDRACDLDQLAGGFVRVGKRTVRCQFDVVVSGGIFVAGFGISQ